MKRKALLFVSLMGIVLLIASKSYGDSVEESAIPTASSQNVSAKQEVTGQNTATITQEISSGLATASTVSTVKSPESRSLEKKTVKPTITIGGGAFFLHRKNFRLIQPQNERESVITQTAGDPFEYDLSGVGSFGNMAIEQPITNDFSVNVSFLGGTLENTQYRPVPGGSNARGGLGADFLADHTSVIPSLNNLGKETGVGNAVQVGAKPNDPTALADTNFTYNTEQYDVALDLIREHVVVLNDFQVDALGGFGYTRVNQDTNLHTKGINVIDFEATETNTAESLNDNLFGGRFGLRVKAKVHPKIFIRSSIIGGMCSDSVRYDGTQDFRNVTGPGIAASGDVVVRQILSADRFVPRLDTRNSLVFQFSPDFSAEISYLFNSFWNLSNVDHPTVVYNDTHSPPPLPPPPPGARIFGTDVINHEVRIGSETVTQHFIELRLVLKF